MLERIRAGLRAFWQFVKYSPNAYLQTIYAIVVEPSSEISARVRQALEHFPDDLHVIAPLGENESDQFQPLPNQRIKVYWKSNYCDQAILVPESVRTQFEYAGQDYLVAYWMARAFGVL